LDKITLEPGWSALTWGLFSGRISLASIMFGRTDHFSIFLPQTHADIDGFFLPEGPNSSMAAGRRHAVCVRRRQKIFSD